VTEPTTVPQRMSPSTLAHYVIDRHPDVSSKEPEGNRIELIVPAERVRDVVGIISELVPDAFPESVFGVDLGNDKYEVMYFFWSHSNLMLCQLRVALEGDSPEVDSVCDMFPGMEWHERETHEMFGIGFRGNPDLRLLLLPDELQGKYPLRKSFKTDRSRLAESGLAESRPTSKESETSG